MPAEANMQHSQKTVFIVLITVKWSVSHEFAFLKYIDDCDIYGVKSVCAKLTFLFFFHKLSDASLYELFSVQTYKPQISLRFMSNMQQNKQN